MKTGAKIIFIILIFFVAACNKTAQENSETVGTEDHVARYDMNPEFASTYLGGNGHEFCEAIAIDGDGNIYVAGNTRSPDFPATEGAYNRSAKGKSDVFIAKFDNDLETLLAATLIGDAEGNMPLHIAAFYRNSENLETILEVNPDLDTINSEGNTPLLLSVRQPDNEKTVALLLKAGADVNIADPAGRNALLVCVDSSQKEYIGILVSKGIDIDSQDKNGNTALHYIFNKVLANKLYIPLCKEMAQPLLEEGADPSIRNEEGKSPLDLAVESGDKELINLLKFSKSTTE